MKKFFSAICGILVGIINGTVGAGGGLVAVPMLKKSGVSQKESHSTAIAVLLPVTVMSAANYLRGGYVTISDALPYVPGAVAGAIIGTVLLAKISTNLLQKIFAIFMLYAGVRLMMR